jgi:hypothetical protein
MLTIPFRRRSGFLDYIVQSAAEAAELLGESHA